MKKIKNIIVPTDFSETARNAYKYAKKLAATIGATVELVHVTEPFIPFPLMSVELTSVESADQFNVKAMEEFIYKEEADTDNSHAMTLVENKIKSKIIRGNVVESLVEISKNKNTDLMVLGTSGLENIMSKIVGSVSLELSNKAHCPVILVPPDATWHKIERMMYSSTYGSAGLKMLKEITHFARSVQAAIHFVHVENSESEGEKNVPELLRNRLSLLDSSDKPIGIHTVYNADTLEALKKYAEVNNINLMVFANKHRSFWQNLIFKSISKNMALSTDVPIMVMHLDDNIK